MAKSLRSKREKRLRAIRREIVEPLYEQKDAAKFAAQEAALAAPKLAVRNTTNSTTTSSMDVSFSVQPSSLNYAMDIDMADHIQGTRSLKPAGGVGKKLKKKLKMGKGKRGGKGKIRRTHI